ncbi:hypothetical protein KIL84_018934 [Mauremys mutica]|uniref:Uncharacterized protein n=1 Tax=Mauremys mutica TaxID=74926 RepID=A0A9D3XVT4_9SAUR|nr:hypothetical protein KIL84_018934 [Mauremys mutica]
MCSHQLHSMERSQCMRKNGEKTVWRGAVPTHNAPTAPLLHRSSLSNLHTVGFQWKLMGFKARHGTCTCKEPITAGGRNPFQEYTNRCSQAMD